MARNKYPEETVERIVDVSIKLFIEKGYENTSIQDILNNLGGLSKGAIYHHFKSKEEIFEAAYRKLEEQSKAYFTQIRDTSYKNGYEKLKTLFQASCCNPTTDMMVALLQKIMVDPKFLAAQLQEIFQVVAPHYLQPIIEEGIADGSIQTAYPKELAEALLTLFNVWINPMINPSQPEELRRKLKFFQELLDGIGVNFLDEELIEQCLSYCACYSKKL